MLLAMAQVNKKDYIAIVHSDEISYGYPRVEMAQVNKKDYIATVHLDEISYGYPRVEMATKKMMATKKIT